MQLLRLLVDLLHRHGALHELLEEGAAGEALKLFELLLIPAQKALLLVLLLDLAAGLLQRLDHRGLGDGLEQILVHVQLDRLARVFEIAVAAEDDDLRVRELAAHDAAEREPVHEGHLDVRDEHVWLELADQRQRHLAVRRVADEREAVLRPGDHIAQTLPHDALILRDKHLDRSHKHPVPLHRFCPYRIEYIISVPAGQEACPSRRQALSGSGKVHNSFKAFNSSFKFFSRGIHFFALL